MTIILYKSEKWQVRKNNSSSLPSVTSFYKKRTNLDVKMNYFYEDISQSQAATNTSFSLENSI